MNTPDVLKMYSQVLQDEQSFSSYTCLPVSYCSREGYNNWLISGNAQFEPSLWKPHTQQQDLGIGCHLIPFTLESTGELIGFIEISWHWICKNGQPALYNNSLPQEYFFENFGTNHLNIGIALASDFRGKGWGEKMTETVIEILFRKFKNVDVIVWSCLMENKASSKIAKKLGFQLGGQYTNSSGDMAFYLLRRPRSTQ